MPTTSTTRTAPRGPRFDLQTFYRWKYASPILRARRSAGLSVGTCAQILNTPATTFRRWQDGETKPAPQHWPALQAVFRLPELQAQYKNWMTRRPKP